MLNRARTIQQNTVELQDICEIDNSNTKCSKDEHVMVALDSINNNDLKLVFSNNQKRFEELNALKYLLRELVRDYAKKDANEYILWSHRLFLHDRKMILSHIIDADDYEFYCSSPTLLELGLEEHDDTIQRLLDEVCSEMYFEDMHEYGRRYVIDGNNGELLFV